MLPVIILGGFQDLYVWLKSALAVGGTDAGEVGVAIALMSAVMFVSGVVVVWREFRKSAEPS
ncbi:hypothetical protein [Rubrivirga sp. IMCC45206]|uniref:hypothetical protein n=1 Tax=Rubrivirga sp. IMCC45206 TaxID=3391614 RepID=UPI00398F9B39